MMVPSTDSEKLQWQFFKKFRRATVLKLLSIAKTLPTTRYSYQKSVYKTIEVQAFTNSQLYQFLLVNHCCAPPPPPRKRWKIISQNLVGAFRLRFILLLQYSFWKQMKFLLEISNLGPVAEIIGGVTPPQPPNLCSWSYNLPPTIHLPITGDSFKCSCELHKR